MHTEDAVKLMTSLGLRRMPLKLRLCDAERRLVEAKRSGQDTREGAVLRRALRNAGSTCTAMTVALSILNDNRDRYVVMEPRSDEVAYFDVYAQSMADKVEMPRCLDTDGVFVYGPAHFLRLAEETPQEELVRMVTSLRDATTECGACGRRGATLACLNCSILLHDECCGKSDQGSFVCRTCRSILGGAVRANRDKTGHVCIPLTPTTTYEDVRAECAKLPSDTYACFCPDTSYRLRLMRDALPDNIPEHERGGKSIQELRHQCYTAMVEGTSAEFSAAYPALGAYVERSEMLARHLALTCRVQTELMRKCAWCSARCATHEEGGEDFCGPACVASFAKYVEEVRGTIRRKARTRRRKAKSPTAPSLAKAEAEAEAEKEPEPEPEPEIEECPLCLEPMGAATIAPDGRHAFHEECWGVYVEAAMQRNKPVLCPMCREVVV